MTSRIAYNNHDTAPLLLDSPFFAVLLRLAAIALILLALCAVRIWSILPQREHPAGRSKSIRSDQDACTVALLLGSGGHTAELLQLLSSLPPNRYHFRKYLVSSGDQLSASKAAVYEASLASPSAERPQHHSIHFLPRARNVHQSFLTTPFSLARALVSCVYLIAIQPPPSGKDDGLFADVILLNGPGTCVPVVLAVYLLRFFGLRSPRLIYVESFARVKSYSLTGKLLRPLVDRFLVQWPQLAGGAIGTPVPKSPRSKQVEYIGCAV